jgi:hypothetical protein
MGGLRGGLLVTLQRLPYHFNYPINILLHIIIPKPQNPVSQTLQKARAISIIIRLVYMLTAIHLNHQPLLDTAEISNEWTNRVLPAELIPIHLPSLQTPPKLHLSRG